MDTQTFAPSDNSYVVNGSPNTNFGTSQDVAIGGWGNIHLFGIRFPMDSVPPANRIVSATLYMRRYMGQATPLTSTRYALITSSWANGSLTWNNRPSGMENNTGIGPVSVPAENNWFSLDITDIVKDWKSGAQANWGLAFNGNAASYTSATTPFTSMRFTSNPSLRPYLEVVSNPAPPPVPHCTVEDCS